jgi:hypothetical protein
VNTTIEKLAATARTGFDLLGTLHFPGEPFTFDVWPRYGGEVRLQFDGDNDAEVLLCYAYALDSVKIHGHSTDTYTHARLVGTWSGTKFSVTGTFYHEDDRAELAKVGDAISLHTLRRLQIQQTARGAR